MAIATNVLEQTEPLERCVTLLERKMVRLENEILVQNHNIGKNWVEMEASVITHRHQLAAHVDRMRIVKESAKCSDCLQPEFKEIKEQVAAIQTVQNGLHDLLEKIPHQLDVQQGESDAGDLAREEVVGEKQPFNLVNLIEAQVPLDLDTNVPTLSEDMRQPLPRVVPPNFEGTFGDIVPSEPFVPLIPTQEIQIEVPFSAQN